MKISRIFRALALIQEEREDCHKRQRKFRQESGDVNSLMLKLCDHEMKQLNVIRNALLDCIAPNDVKKSAVEEK